MTCLEAQSNIMGFIDKKLPDDRVTEFVRHVKNCPNCMEELEIHYTLIVGMRELDNNKELPSNLKKDLENELNRWDNRVKNVKRFKISTFGIVFVTVVILFFIIYGQILNKVYDIEQRIIKEKQGNYYFYELFDDYMSFDKKDLLIVSREDNKPVEKTYYEKIHVYNITHVDDEGETEQENEYE